VGKPDIVLMMFGTNDVMSNKSPAQITDAYTWALKKIRAVNPTVHMIISKLPPVSASSCYGCSSSIPALNSAIDVWANQQTTGDSPIFVVDQFTGFNAATDTYDGIHPGPSGEEKYFKNLIQPVEKSLAAKKTR
jgi:lysophospholipase L1-like esterase